MPEAKLVAKTIKEDPEHDNRDENVGDEDEAELKKRELFKTFQLLPPARGADPSLRRGPNDKLLL